MAPMTYLASPSVSVKRVRFSPDVKDSDNVSSPAASISSSFASPRVLPKTPRPIHLQQNLFPPSPPLSDASSLGDEQQYVHSYLSPRTIVLDVRAIVAGAYIAPSPRTGPIPLLISREFIQPATQPVLRRMQLVSRYLPWTITVENPQGISIGDVLFSIHESLHRTASKEEYASADQRMQTEILRAYQRNYTVPTANPAFPPRTREGGVKRVDWLGKRTLFAGIQKDERFIASRVADPGVRAETFVLEFASAA